MKRYLTRREFLYLSGMVGAGALAASCGPGAAPTASKTTLLVWDSWGDDAAAMDAMVAEFNQSQAGVEVKRENLPAENVRDVLKTALDSGSGPDIMYFDTGPGFGGVLARAGLLLPLDDAYAQKGWNDRLLPVARDRATYDGKSYGIGNELEVVGVFYNKRIFDEQGLGEPKTHAEFLAACARLKQAGLIPVAFSDQNKWPAGHMFSVFAGNIAGKDKLAAAISGEVPWNDADFVRAIQTFFVEMNEAGYFIPDVNAVTYADANGLFYAGQAAMALTGTWMIEDYTNPETMADPVGFFFYPTVDGKPIAPPAGLGSGYFVSKTTKSAEASAAFLDFLFSREAAKRWIEGLSRIPAMKLNPADYEVSDLMRFVLQSLQDHGDKMGYNIDVLTPENFNTIMFDGFQEVLGGTKTPQQQADDLQAAMQQAKAEGKTFDITP